MARTGSAKGRGRARDAGSEASADDVTPEVVEAATAESTDAPNNPAPTENRWPVAPDDAPAEAGDAPGAAWPEDPRAAESDGTHAPETAAQAENASEPEPEPVTPPLADPIPLAGPTASPPTPAPSATAEAPRRGGTVWLLLGGVAAAAIGAGTVLAMFPQGWQPRDNETLESRLSTLENRAPGAVDLAPIESTLAEMQARIDALDTALAQSRAASPELPDLGPIESRLSALESAPAPEPLSIDTALAPVQERIDGISAALGPMRERLDALENTVTTQIDAAVGAALAVGQRAQNEQAEAIAEAEESLREQAARLAGQAALATLIAAAESGEPAGAALDTLGGAVDLPPALAPLRDGLPTLGALQTAFPAAARAALVAAPVAPEASATDRLMGFLRSQTGARSLAPREGMDTDAILSRAEARLRAGELQATVDEISTLPAEPAAEMAAWLADAQARLSALSALDALGAQLLDQ